MGNHNVYARWAVDAAKATFTVHYAGGTTVVSMNQTQHGGQWNPSVPLPSTTGRTRRSGCPIRPICAW
ncbi:hypothetical protein [Nitrospira sp.]